MRTSSSCLVLASSAAGILLVILCGMTLASGVSQQTFEAVAPPEIYAAMLVRGAAWLRALVAVDDLFIAAYVTATLLLARWLARDGWHVLHTVIVVLGVTAGVLDLEENHHILAMLRIAQHGVAIPLEAILRRTDLSQLKWMLGHLAFVLVGVVLAGRDALTRIFRISLIGLQLPVGALVWAIDDPTWHVVLVWARYVAFLAGFFTIPVLVVRGERGAGASATGSGVRA
jgi:hypothetical protein